MPCKSIEAALAAQLTGTEPFHVFAGEFELHQVNGLAGANEATLTGTTGSDTLESDAETLTASLYGTGYRFDLYGTAQATMTATDNPSALVTATMTCASPRAALSAPIVRRGSPKTWREPQASGSVPLSITIASSLVPVAR